MSMWPRWRALLTGLLVLSVGTITGSPVAFANHYTCDTLQTTIDGSEFGDDIPPPSTSGSDVINSRAGNDTVKANANQDRACGGLGNDVVHGGADHDVVRGGSGTDDSLGEYGEDWIYADQGVSDYAWDGYDHDYVNVQDGESSDTIWLCSDNSTDALVVDNYSLEVVSESMEACTGGSIG